MDNITLKTAGNRLYAISGLKIIVLFLIFLMHSNINVFDLNIARRGVEFFFVTSGFLAFYSKKDIDFNCDFITTINYVKRKLISIIPIYLLCFLYYLVISRPSVWVAIVNLLMLQAWSSDSNVYFSLNGPSWYISSLLFCYLLFPLFNKIVKTTNTYFLMFVFVLVRFLLEFLIVKDILFFADVHCWPVIRLIDFTIGMMTAKIFIKLSEKNITKFGFIFSIVEVTILIIVILLDLYLGKLLPRSLFVCVFSLLILTFAFGKGVLSKIVSCKGLKSLSKYQLEFYLFHAPVGSFISLSLKYGLGITNIHPAIKVSIALILILICCFVYKRFFKLKLEKITEKCLNILVNIKTSCE